MLPLGVLDLGRRKTRFTPDEQVTLMTLWCMARSPLIMGGDLRKLDDATLALLTNDEVLAVNRASGDNHQVSNKDGVVLWQARQTSGPDTYVAVFNIREPATGLADIKVSLAELGLKGLHRVRDLWKRADLTTAQEHFAASVAAHGAALFRLSPLQTNRT